MPLPLLTLAIPVVHSSGAWIASSGGAYVAGTLSSSWVGAFVAGNLGFLSSAGFSSGASIVGLMAVPSSATVGSALTSVGLGGVATSLGLVPATFLGLTAPVWMGVGVGVAAVMSSSATYMIWKQMRTLNTERQKGGLEKITLFELLREIKAFERQSVERICNELSQEIPGLEFNGETKIVKYESEECSIKNIHCEIATDSQEYLVLKISKHKETKIKNDFNLQQG